MVTTRTVAASCELGQQVPYLDRVCDYAPIRVSQEIVTTPLPRVAGATVKVASVLLNQ
jgi:hypothetical protein